MIGQELITLLGFKVDAGSMKQANAAVQGLRKSMDGVKNTLRNLGGGLAGLAGIGSVGFLTKSVIDYTADMEMLTAQFKVLIGSQTEAEAHMDKLRKMAAVTPLETKQLAAGARLMMAYGVEAKDTYGYLSALGDITQGDVNRFNQLNLAFSQMISLGRLAGQELRQMTEAGYNPLRTVGDMLGKSQEDLRAMMARGEMSSSLILQAMAKDVGQGGRYYEGMFEGSKTFAGLWSNMKDNIDLIKLEIGDQILPRMKLVLNYFVGWLQEGLTPLARQAAPIFRNIFDVVVYVGHAVGKIFSDIGGDIVRFGWVASNALRSIATIGVKALATIYWVIAPLVDELKNQFIEFFGDLWQQGEETATKVTGNLENFLSTIRSLFGVLAWIVSVGITITKWVGWVAEKITEYPAAISAVGAALVALIFNAMFGAKLALFFAGQAAVAAVATATETVAAVGAIGTATAASATAIGTAAATSTVAVQALSAEAIIAGTAVTTAMSPLIPILVMIGATAGSAFYIFQQWKDMNKKIDTGEYGTKMLLENSQKELDNAKEKARFYSRMDSGRGKELAKQWEAKIPGLEKSTKVLRDMYEGVQKDPTHIWGKPAEKKDEYGIKASLDEYLKEFDFSPEKLMAPILKSKIADLIINQQVDIHAPTDDEGKTKLTPNSLAKAADMAMRSMWNIKLTRSIVEAYS